MRELQLRRGYQEISTPILVHEKLWLQSGHLPLYADNMFLVESEGQTFSLKPMNCPESTFIYRSRLRSYRDLPLRLSEYGRLHRNERSGTLSGLTRVRQFIQDDAHIYVRPDQLADEFEALLGEVAEAYSWVGLSPRFAFATKPDKAIGDPALWEKAEALIKEALDRSGASYVVKPKDGTFYAPKIDIYIDDALGREWQMATIQADLTMLPEQFDLTYIDEHDQPQRPIAIHRAIYGSLERFIGILVNEKLWLQSGHLPLYADNMFLLQVEGQTFGLKPMNCPESTFIYRSRLRSYRDLPLRYNEYGRLHRNERSGTLSGLTRVRQFVQDDAHIFVRPDQLADEIEALLGEVQEAVSYVGLTPRFAFATKPDKALGDPALWEKAEALIKEALDRSGAQYVVKPKDGTFYAPKIDICLLY